VNTAIAIPIRSALGFHDVKILGDQIPCIFEAVNVISNIYIVRMTLNSSYLAS
jgi:hypothetical protein